MALPLLTIPDSLLCVILENIQRDDPDEWYLLFLFCSKAMQKTISRLSTNVVIPQRITDATLRFMQKHMHGITRITFDSYDCVSHDEHSGEVMATFIHTLRNTIKHMHIHDYCFNRMDPEPIDYHDHEDTYLAPYLLPHLFPLPHLETLTIENQIVQNTWDISRCFTLTKLTLINTTEITDDGLYHIAFFLRNLQEFSFQYTNTYQRDLRECRPEYRHCVSFYSLFQLGRHCPLLQRIAFSHVSLSYRQQLNGEDSDKYWAPVEGCFDTPVGAGLFSESHAQMFRRHLEAPQSLFLALKSLDLCHCIGLEHSNEQSPLIRLLGILNARGKTLDSLNLSSTDISDETVEIVSQTYGLKNVSLFSCPNVSDSKLIRNIGSKQ